MSNIDFKYDLIFFLVSIFSLYLLLIGVVFYLRKSHRKQEISIESHKYSLEKVGKIEEIG